MIKQRIVTRRKKIVGRGYGSGKGGHTSGRGQKGQKSRGSLGIMFEGVKVRKSLYKRLPLGRGKGKFKARSKPIILNLDILNIFPDGATVDLKSLVEKGIVDKEGASTFGVKILGGGLLEKKLTVLLPSSKSAAEKITKMGGKMSKT